MVFDFLLCDNQNDLFTHNMYVMKIAMRCSTNFNALSNVANALGNVANAFENNNSALESVANGLKYIATHFQCIFHRIFNAFFNAFSMHFRLVSNAGFSQIGSHIKNKLN